MKEEENDQPEMDASETLKLEERGEEVEEAWKAEEEEEEDDGFFMTALTQEEFSSTSTPPLVKNDAPHTSKSQPRISQGIPEMKSVDICHGTSTSTMNAAHTAQGQDSAKAPHTSRATAATAAQKPTPTTPTTPVPTVLKPQLLPATSVNSPLLRSDMQFNLNKENTHMRPWEEEEVFEDIRGGEDGRKIEDRSVQHHKVS